MGDCDKFKQYISDYLEGNLDSTTRKEFEEAMEENKELSEMTTRMKEIRVLLNKLPAKKCSDDFTANLHRKIHSSSSQSRLPVTPLKKYSYAFSFAVLAVIIIFSVNMFDGTESSVNDLPESSNIERQDQSPAIQRPTQPVSNSRLNDKEVDIKTVDEQKTVADSVKNSEKDASRNNIKYVDDKKK